MSPVVAFPAAPPPAAVQIGQIAVREPYAIRAVRIPVEVTPDNQVRVGLYELADRASLLSLIADLAIAAQLLDR